MTKKRHYFTKIYYIREHIKIFILVGIITFILILLKVNHIFENIYLQSPVKIGVSYSPSYTKALGLDPRHTFQTILQELNVKHIRLSAYWDEIEAVRGKYSFDDLDFYINTAASRKTSVILTIGYKLPRWPECRAPGWIDIKGSDFRAEQLKMIEQVINRYDQNPAISAYQVENEPLLDFGVCPPANQKFLEQEIKFIKAISKKPLILTDSGELSTWITSMKLSDYFGTTVYRTVNNDLIGTFTYPIKPWLYRLKSILVRKVFARENQKTIITELQAEPWSTTFITNVPIKDQVDSFTPQTFQGNVNYAKRTGFDEIYLWGVEWWYFIKLQGYPKYWDLAKTLF